MTDELLSYYQLLLIQIATLQYGEYRAQIKIVLYETCRQYTCHIVAAYVESPFPCCLSMVGLFKSSTHS